MFPFIIFFKLYKEAKWSIAPMGGMRVRSVRRTDLKSLTQQNKPLKILFGKSSYAVYRRITLLYFSLDGKVTKDQRLPPFC